MAVTVNSACLLFARVTFSSGTFKMYLLFLPDIYSGKYERELPLPGYLFQNIGATFEARKAIRLNDG